jgi:hypothetical protein
MGAGARAWLGDLTGRTGHHAYVVDADGSTWWTPGFPLAP